MHLETFGGITHLLQAGRTQVLILLIVQEAHSHSSGAWALCLTHGLHGTTPPGFGTMAGEWAIVLDQVMVGITVGIMAGAGTIHTVGTMAGDMDITLMAMDTTLMAMDTTHTDGTTVGILTIHGQLPAIAALVQEQPPQERQLERITEIDDLLNIHLLEVLV